MVVGASAHGTDELSGGHGTGNWFGYPISLLFVPALIDYIRQEGSLHIGIVGRLEIRREVVGRSRIVTTPDVDAVRLRHLLRGCAVAFEVIALREQILGTVVPPLANNSLAMSKVLVHMLACAPLDLSRKYNLEWTWLPPSSERLEVLVELVVHEFKAPVGPFIRGNILIPFTSKTNDKIGRTVAACTQRLWQHRHMRNYELAAGQRFDNLIDGLLVGTIDAQNGNMDRIRRGNLFRNVISWLAE